MNGEPCIKLSWFDEKNGDPDHSEEHVIFIDAIKTVLLLIAYKGRF